MSVEPPREPGVRDDQLERSEDESRAALPAASWVTGEGLVPGDAYLEGAYVVFTAQYHLRRGYCCNSSCRHCPYRDANAADTA